MNFKSPAAMAGRVFRRARILPCLLTLGWLAGWVSGLMTERAAAQDAAFEIAGWDVVPRASATLVLAPGRDGTSERDAERVTAELAAAVDINRVLDNGVKLGTQIGGRLQRDHPSRAGFSGQIGPFDPDFSGLAARGAFTGLTAGGAEDRRDTRVQLETAFAYIDGGYGELLVGRDIGIAARFYEGSPSVFRLHTVSNARLDTSGIATVLTRHDLTGPSAKISYASPRLLGLRLGASYTPRANVSGLDRDPSRDVAGVAEPRLENGLEAAFNFRHRFAQAGIRVEAYGAYGRADLDTGPLQVDTGTVEVWSSGGWLEWENVQFGADWLTSDNGDARYRAWSIGGQTRIIDLDWSAEYGRSFDELTGIDGRTWSFGIAHEFAKRLTITAGLQRQELSGRGLSDRASTGPVLEMTLRY